MVDAHCVEEAQEDIFSFSQKGVVEHLIMFNDSISKKNIRLDEDMTF